MRAFSGIFLLQLLMIWSSVTSAQCYEMEIGVAYQSDMSASDIVAFDMQAVIDEANAILQASNMSAKPVLVVTTILDGQSNFTLGEPCFPNSLSSTYFADPFLTDPDIALYITETAFSETEYGCGWRGTPSNSGFNFWRACEASNGNATLMINQDNITTNARLLIRLIGGHFSAISPPGTIGVFAHDIENMTSFIDVQNGAFISAEMPLVTCLEVINCPSSLTPCDNNIVTLQGPIQLSSDTIYASSYIKTIGDVSIPALADIKLYAGDSIVLESEFTVAETGILEADIRNCQ